MFLDCVCYAIQMDRLSMIEFSWSTHVEVVHCTSMAVASATVLLILIILSNLATNTNTNTNISKPPS